MRKKVIALVLISVDVLESWFIGFVRLIEFVGLKKLQFLHMSDLVISRL